MSIAYNKAKGRTWETGCVSFLIEHGRVNAERRRLSGAQDRGDIAGVPGVVWECKNGRTYDLPGWMREAQVEKVNDGAHLGVVWMRLMGKPRAGDGLILMRPEEFLWLLDRAGM